MVSSDMFTVTNLKGFRKNFHIFSDFLITIKPEKPPGIGCSPAQVTGGGVFSQIFDDTGDFGLIPLMYP